MYQERSFSFGTLDGISEKTMDTHLKLYSGYVKHTNLILEKIKEYSKDSETHAYALGELQRRFSFEWNGMRNHELFFASLEGGASELGDGELKSAIEKDFGSFDAWLSRFKAIAKTRGIGWAILYHDPATDKLINAWVDEQHLGHLNSAHYLIGIDMWEHAYLLDYAPSDKGTYIDAYFKNLNWKTVEEMYSSMK